MHISAPGTRISACANKLNFFVLFEAQLFLCFFTLQVVLPGIWILWGRVVTFSLDILISLLWITSNSTWHYKWHSILTITDHHLLKPSNILLTREKWAKLADFGMSVTNFDQELTAETGTYQWVAPEVIRHESYSSNVDVYSFGVGLWQLITWTSFCISKSNPDSLCHFRGM